MTKLIKQVSLIYISAGFSMIIDSLLAAEGSGQELMEAA